MRSDIALVIPRRCSFVSVYPSHPRQDRLRCRCTMGFSPPPPLRLPVDPFGRFIFLGIDCAPCVALLLPCLSVSGPKLVYNYYHGVRIPFSLWVPPSLSCIYVNCIMPLTFGYVKVIWNPWRPTAEEGGTPWEYYAISRGRLPSGGSCVLMDRLRFASIDFLSVSQPAFLGPMLGSGGPISIA